MNVAQRLRQKLLELAIHGKLVPQNPKDEPTGELLARIRAEKANLVAAKKIKKEKPLPPIAKDEQPFDLPKGWAWCRFRELGVLTGGHTPSMANPKFWNGDVLWVTSKDMKRKYIADTGSKITKLGAEELTMLEPGAILMCTRSGILRRTFPVAIAAKPLTINQDQRALSLMFSEMAEFVYAVLCALEPTILADYRKTGTTVESIIWEKFIDMPLPLPPLVEQKRIAAKLNEMLATCDCVAEGETRLTHLQQKARAKILDLAIRGKLVKQDKSDEPAAELLKKITAEKVKLVAAKTIKKEKPLPPITEDEQPFDLPKGWTWCRLIDVVQSPPKNGYSPAPVDYDTGVRRLVLSATTKGVFDPTAYKFIDADIPKDSYLWVRKDDVLIQRSNSLDYLGMSCVYRGEDCQFVYPDLMMKVRVNGAINLEYFDYALKSHVTHKYFVDHATGTAGNMPKINGEVVMLTPIPLPPLAEQKRIVAKVKEMLAACEVLGGAK